MSKNLQNILMKLNLSATIRSDTLHDRPQVVAPIVILVEGVHHGSGGPLYYPAEEIAKFAEAWNGRPVPVYHPTTADGLPECCNSPEVLERSVVGQVFGAAWDPAKRRLVGEVWIDIQKANAIDPSIVPRIRNHDAFEISSGLYSDDDGTPGEWNGEAYEATLMNFRPDHIALLPTGTGACSWEDGCGIRANASKWGSKTKDVHVVVLVNADEASYEEIVQQLQAFVDDKDIWSQNSDVPSTLHFVEAVYDGFFVYRQSGPAGTKYYKAEYSVNADGTAEVNGESTETVRKVISYAPVANVTAAATQTVTTNDSGGTKMSDKKKKDCCPEEVLALVNELVSNETTVWVEADRESLQVMTVEMLKKMLPPAEDPKANAAAEAAAAAAAAAATANEDVSAAEYIQNAPDGIRQTLNRAYKRDQDHKAQLIGNILKSPRNEFSRETLETMDLDALEAIGKLAEVKTNFAAAAPEGVTDNQGDQADAGEPMATPTFASPKAA